MVLLAASAGAQQECCQKDFLFATGGPSVLSTNCAGLATGRPFVLSTKRWLLRLAGYPTPVSLFSLTPILEQYPF
jgi:hypothetical protein